MVRAGRSEGWSLLGEQRLGPRRGAPDTGALCWPVAVSYASAETSSTVGSRRLGWSERFALTEWDEGTLHKSKTPDRALRSNALFVRFLVLVLSIAVLVLVLGAIPSIAIRPYWSASSREPLRSTIGIAAVQTAIEYEYRFTEYRPPRRTEYRFAEYDEIRCEARTKRSPRTRSCVTSIRDAVSVATSRKQLLGWKYPRPPVGSSDRKHSFIS